MPRGARVRARAGVGAWVCAARGRQVSRLSGSVAERIPMPAMKYDIFFGRVYTLRSFVPRAVRPPLSHASDRTVYSRGCTDYPLII